MVRRPHATTPTIAPLLVCIRMISAFRSICVYCCGLRCLVCETVGVHDFETSAIPRNKMQLHVLTPWLASTHSHQTDVDVKPSTDTSTEEEQQPADEDQDQEDQPAPSPEPSPTPTTTTASVAPPPETQQPEPTTTTTQPVLPPEPSLTTEQGEPAQTSVCASGPTPSFVSSLSPDSAQRQCSRFHNHEAHLIHNCGSGGYCSCEERSCATSCVSSQLSMSESPQDRVDRVLPLCARTADVYHHEYAA